MKKYEKVLKEYSSDEYLLFAGFSEEEWGNKKVAEEYLQKYWLPQKEYENIWKPIQDTIFINQDKTLPEMMFSKSYSIIALRGGILLDAFLFRQLQKCMLAIGEKNFVIIQQEPHPDHLVPLLRLKYPVAISWQDL